MRWRFIDEGLIGEVDVYARRRQSQCAENVFITLPCSMGTFETANFMEVVWLEEGRKKEGESKVSCACD